MGDGTLFIVSTIRQASKSASMGLTFENELGTLEMNSISPIVFLYGSCRAPGASRRKVIAPLFIGPVVFA